MNSVFDLVLEKEMKILAKTYDSTMNVTRPGSNKVKINGKTSFEDTVIYEDVPCAIKRDSKSQNNQTDSANNISYTEILFTLPDLVILQGDEIEITLKNNIVIKYIAGTSEWLTSHQEIIVERKDRA